MAKNHDLKAISLPEKEKIAEKLRDIVYPRFNTAEFETATTRSGRRHSIHKLYYVLEEERGYPIKASGYVWGGLTERKIEWDKHGRAFNSFGMRESDFDLIRENEKEINAARNIAGALFAGILVIVICSIFQSGF